MAAANSDSEVKREPSSREVELHILLVEDDEEIAVPLAAGLRRHGFGVTHVPTAEAALAAEGSDLVLLDLGLADLDGFEVCRRLRERSDVPIIIITARGEEIDRVMGLHLGADDYVVKPFGFRELVARVQAVARRAGPASKAPEEASSVAGGDPSEGRTLVTGSSSPRRRHGDVVSDGCGGTLTVDRRTRKVLLDGRNVAVTSREFELLVLLAEDPGAVRTRQDILERAWGADWYGSSRTLDVHVANLRSKLGDARWIETVRGIGYRLYYRG